MKKFLLLLAALFNGLPTYAVERPLVAVIPSYKNALYYQKNLDSLFSQNYENFRVIYVDDASPDGTADLVERYMEEHGVFDRFTLIRNEENKGGMYNTYIAVHQCLDEEIVLTVDGDDWLEHDEVFSTINSVYEDENVWLTYGSFIRYPDGKKRVCPPFPAAVVAKKSYRTHTWISTQLRTFYAGLFKQIRKSDLMYKGEFFQSAWDLAMMYPMLEMADGRITNIEDINYVYNRENVMSDNKVNNMKDILRLDKLIRRKKRYDRLDDLSFERV